MALWPQCPDLVSSVADQQGHPTVLSWPLLATLSSLTKLSKGWIQLILLQDLQACDRRGQDHSC